ncbi:ABC transporter ATP-binding protein [Mycoplasma todarodis]|uniref:ABC transporter ATP-binding protein n=1 Tax=Mycoplasma todarodis TaxID=1937191 RepID=A0A4R0XSN7_9MOLU|nr:ABC transporter ATP-binding protein [Mycoplasma todarodis]TCG11450.1 ABC transporter ATP-binding protein [Mycoplasma todarodis]
MARKEELEAIKRELGLPTEKSPKTTLSTAQPEKRESKADEEVQKKNPNIDYSKPSLEVKGFTKRYKGSKIPAVENVEFQVMPGEFHGFIGANGAGKTTTIKSLIGAYAKFEGSVKMFGHKHTTLEAKRHIGYIPEAAKFPKGMSTLSYITFMSYLSGMSMSNAKKYAKEKLIELGLEKVMKRSPNTFSSGQKKKVLLAQALVHNPDIIIMDEPAANLDPKARFEFFQDLKKLQHQGKSIFISSHILAELDKFVDSLTIVDGGRIVFTGSMKQATENPDLEYFIKGNTKKDDKIIIAVAEKLGINYKEEDGGFIFQMIERKNIIKVMEYFAKAKLVVDTFKNRKMSLEEVYKKYVLLGSRETGTGKVGK